MTFLPIVDRELRVRARNRVTFRARIGAALIAILIVGFFLLAAQAQFSPSRLGQRLFWILSTVAFLWCLTEGPRNTADSLSEEKRAGTLGLLFLTDLKPYDVIFGKLFATSLNSFYGVLAILPPLGIPLLLGGVTPGEFWRMVLLLIVTLFFSLSAGLLISAASREERRAWAGTAFLVALLTIVPPLLRWLPNPSTMLLAWCSPAVAFRSLGDAAFSSSAQAYWQSILGVHLLSWAFLIAASFVLPNAWQDKPVQKANREVASGTRLRTEVERRRAMHLNPVVWMLTRGQRAEWYVWAAILIVGVPSMALAFAWRSGFVIGPLIGVALALNFALAIWVAAKSCFMVFDARSSGALELLITTPLPDDVVVNGLMEALKRQFTGPFVALCAMELAVAISIVAFDSSSTAAEFAFTVVLTLLACGLVAAELMATAWFGLWSGLTAKKGANAVVKTILYVLVLPMVFMCCWFLWPIFAIAKDAIFINYARTKLHKEFRNIITEGATKPLELWPRPKPWPPKLPNVLEK